MRLLYLVPEFPSQTHAFFWREVMGLRSLGVEVVLVSTRRPPPNACRHAFAQEAANQTHYLFPPDWVADSLYLLTRPKAIFHALAYVTGLKESRWGERLKAGPLLLPAARLARLAGRLGVRHLHVHSFANSAHVAALAKILGGCAYSLTLHGDLEVYGKDHDSKVRHASFVTCVTTALKNQVMDKLRLPSSFVHLVWMGVDTAVFAPVDKPVRVEREPLRLLTVARLNAVKGHRHALEALKQLKSRGVKAYYTIVGDGPEKDAILQKIKDSGLTDQVSMTGTRSESEVLSLLQSSDALLLPSVGLGEAAPVAVMEAMSCGLPVICSIIGGTPDMIEDGKDGFLVEQADEKAIADRVLWIDQEPARVAAMSQAARTRALRDFDSKRLAARLLSLIEEEP